MSVALDLVAVTSSGAGSAAPRRPAGRPRRPPPRRSPAGRPGRRGSSGASDCRGHQVTPRRGSAGPGRAALGQHPAGHTVVARPERAERRRRPVSPRTTAARSSTSSRTAATNRGSVPTVAARVTGRPSRSRGRERLGVEVVHRPPCGRRRSRSAPARPPGTPSRGQRLEVVVDVRLQPRLGRRAAAAAVDEVELVVGARSPSATPAVTRSATSRCWAT